MPDTTLALAAQRCDNCVFYHPQPGLNVCRRYPPIIINVSTLHTSYPPVKANYWCGDWQAPPAPAVEPLTP